MKNHSRGHKKNSSPGYRTPSTFRADAKFRAQKNRPLKTKDGWK